MLPRLGSCVLLLVVVVALADDHVSDWDWDALAWPVVVQRWLGMRNVRYPAT